MKDKIKDLLYLPFFVGRYRKNYSNIKKCIKDYFLYYAIEKKEI